MIGFLTVMLILGLLLSRRFSGHASLAISADRTTAVRYYLESCVADALWQIRCQRNDHGTPLYNAFRSGTSGGAVTFNYQQSQPVKTLAKSLPATLKPGFPQLVLQDLKQLGYHEAFRICGTTEEKTGTLAIRVCARAFGRDYTLEQKFPFKVVLQVTPLLRKFVLYFDRLHLEQASIGGFQDKLNIIPIHRNLPRSNRTPLALFGWDFADRDRNGAVFLGSDERKIFLNLVGGQFEKNSQQTDLEDLWQISPSAFEMTEGYREFGETPLLNDSEGDTLYVRGAGIGLAYRGHFARFGILGFSEELGGAGSALLGDFNLSNFLNQDPAFNALKQSGDSLQQSSVLRLRGNRIQPDFPGFARDIYGNVFARFFLLSFFEAPSVGSPVFFSSNPDQELSFQQYGNAQRITFKPSRGRYCHYMSRIVSGGKEVPGLGNSANVPLHRDHDDRHVLLRSQHVPATDGLRPAGPLTGLGSAWLPDGPYDGPNGRPCEDRNSVLGRVSRWFLSQADFKKAVGLTGPGTRRCWVDGVVYVHGPLDLSEGITTADIRGGVVLVRGPITLGNVTRGVPTKGLIPAAATLPQNKMLTFVSLTGAEITLSGNAYLGVHLLSFRAGLSVPTSQLSVSKGGDFTFLGAMGVNTPMLERMSRQLVQRGMFPMINYLPSLAATTASTTVNIRDRVVDYDFHVL